MLTLGQGDGTEDAGMDDLILGLTLVAALGAALMAGFFFAYSFSVMWALGKVPSAQGIAAMQAINLVVPNPIFLPVFLGEAVLSLVLGVAAVARWDESGSEYLLVGSVAYLICSMLLTFAFHIPRNNALAKVALESAAGAELWTRYLREWTPGNHIRTLGCVVATAAFVLAFRYVA